MRTSELAQIVPFERFDLLLDNLEYHEQSRHDEYLANHTNKHTAHGTGTQGSVTIGSYNRWQTS